MKHKVKIGVVCLARTTFDFRAALEIYERMQPQLAQMENVEFVFEPGLVIEVDEARRAAERLAAANVEGVVCISGTFHLGHLALEIRKTVAKPFLLWAWNELPYNGGKIRLNSVCGLNLNASNFYKAGVRDYHVCIGDQIDEDWIDALRILSAFRNARIGIIGFRAHGFFNLGVADLELYRELGVLVDHFELSDVFGFEVDSARVQHWAGKVRSTFDLSGITQEQADKVSLLTAKFEAFLNKHGLTSLAVRCWPEFAATFGISPCAAMSLLQAEGRIMACEGDLEGALSMLAHTAVGARTPFLFDFSQVDFQEESALFWHCGVAPANLWDGESVRSLDTYFAGGKGVTADFVLRPGELSVVRLDSACGETRVFLLKGTAVPMTKDLRGTYAKVKFGEPVRDILNRVVDNGIAHHASMAYGDWIKPFRILAKLKGWKVIE